MHSDMCDITNESFPKIYIIGSSLVQNQLLALCLEKELKVECICQKNLTTKKIIKKAPERIRVLLLDCLKSETIALEKCLKSVVTPHMDSFRSALFNVTPSTHIEKLLHRHTIWGIFYKNDTRQIFLKGMRAILNGDMWLSRRILSACAMNANHYYRGSALLTDRENETLWLLAEGFSNEEIAKKMHLSRSTVKSHLYHIYKKIDVSNRLQAAVVSAAHLCEPPKRKARRPRTDKTVIKG